jgi:glycosyltransferase involved in cell wall biosynthesis
MAVIACVIVFNEETMLPGCLESLEDAPVDEVVVVDGAYRDFSHEQPWSTDATREIARAYGATWIQSPETWAWESEVEKRNAYLIGDEGDWYFQIDADERLIGALPALEPGRVYALQVRRRDGGISYVPRLFQHLGHTRYYGAHHHLWRDDVMIWHEEWVRVAREQGYLLHLSHLRSVARQRAKAAWLPGKRERERRYRRAQGV